MHHAKVEIGCLMMLLSPPCTVETEISRQRAELGIGAKSGLADVKEGERDPRTGRVVLDPLKIPTAAQGGEHAAAVNQIMRANELRERG